MANTYFTCTECHQSLVIDDTALGTEVVCPLCAQPTIVPFCADPEPPPTTASPQVPAEAPVSKCPACGAPIHPHFAVCLECGLNLKTGENVRNKPNPLSPPVFESVVEQSSERSDVSRQPTSAGHRLTYEESLQAKIDAVMDTDPVGSCPETALAVHARLKEKIIQDMRSEGNSNLEPVIAALDDPHTIEQIFAKRFKDVTSWWQRAYSQRLEVMDTSTFMKANIYIDSVYRANVAVDSAVEYLFDCIRTVRIHGPSPEGVLGIPERYEGGLKSNYVTPPNEWCQPDVVGIACGVCYCLLRKWAEQQRKPG